MASQKAAVDQTAGLKRNADQIEAFSSDSDDGEELAMEKVSKKVKLQAVREKMEAEQGRWEDQDPPTLHKRLGRLRDDNRLQKARHDRETVVLQDTNKISEARVQDLKQQLQAALAKIQRRDERVQSMKKAVSESTGTYQQAVNDFHAERISKDAEITRRGAVMATHSASIKQQTVEISRMVGTITGQTVKLTANRQTIVGYEAHIAVMYREQEDSLAYQDSLGDQDPVALRAQIMAMKTFTERLQQDLLDTEKDLKNVTQARDELEVTLFSKEATPKQAQEALEKARLDLVSAVEQIDSLNVRLDEMGNELEQSKGCVTTLEGELHEVTRELEQSKGCVTTLEGKLYEVTRELEQSKGCVTTLEGKLYEVTRELEQSKGCVTTLEGKLRDLTAQLGGGKKVTLPTQDQGVQQKINSLGWEVHYLKLALAERDVHLGHLQSTLAGRDARLGHLQSTLAEREQTVSRLQKALSERNMFATGQTKQLEDKDKRVAAMRNCIDMKDREIKGKISDAVVFQKRLAAAEFNATVHEDTLSASRKNASELQKTVQELHARIAAAEAPGAL
jgi:chromosome segregation ATPase